MRLRIAACFSYWLASGWKEKHRLLCVFGWNIADLAAINGDKGEKINLLVPV